MKTAWVSNGKYYTTASITTNHILRSRVRETPSSNRVTSLWRWDIVYPKESNTVYYTKFLYRRGIGFITEVATTTLYGKRKNTIYCVSIAPSIVYHYICSFLLLSTSSDNSLKGGFAFVLPSFKPWPSLGGDNWRGFKKDFEYKPNFR